MLPDGSSAVVTNHLEKPTPENEMASERFYGIRGFCLHYKAVVAIIVVISAALIISLCVVGTHFQSNQRSIDEDNFVDVSVVPLPQTTSSILTTQPTSTVQVSPPEEASYEFVNRSQYGAVTPKKEAEPLSLPVKQVVIAHTGAERCTTFETCSATVRGIQSYHMNSNGWDDIGLNFLVGGDGRAYQGRDYKVGAHTKNYNAGSICISFIGNFNFTKVPATQLRAAQRFIEDGIKSQQIHPHYALYGQRQLKDTASPGDELYKEIILWENWSAEIIPL